MSKTIKNKNTKNKNTKNKMTRNIKPEKKRNTKKIKGGYLKFLHRVFLPTKKPNIKAEIIDRKINPNKNFSDINSEIDIEFPNKIYKTGYTEPTIIDNYVSKRYTDKYRSIPDVEINSRPKVFKTSILEPVIFENYLSPENKKLSSYRYVPIEGQIEDIKYNSGDSGNDSDNDSMQTEPDFTLEENKKFIEQLQEDILRQSQMNKNGGKTRKRINKFIKPNRNNFYKI